MLDTLNSYMTLIHLSTPHILPSDEIPWTVLIIELVSAALLLVLAFLLRRRFLKIICLCGMEVCLFLACKMAFGPESWVTTAMRWVTAAVACIVTVSIVNRINWNEIRTKSDK